MAESFRNVREAQVAATLEELKVELDTQQHSFQVVEIAGGWRLVSRREIMMFTISWQMTLVALATLPLSFGILGLIISKSQVFFKRQQDYLGHINGHVEEMYGGHVVVKAFNGEAKSVEIF